MKLDPAVRELEIVESEVLVLQQSRIAVNIALEGERSQNCEAFVCGGKSETDYWVAAGVYLNMGRRTLIYRHDPIGKDKAAFDAAVQDALNFLIPLGFELDSVNLKYSQAMRQVILKGIRGIGFAGKAAPKKQSPLDPRRTAMKGKDGAEAAAEAAVDEVPAAVTKKVEPAAGVAPAPVVPTVLEPVAMTPPVAPPVAPVPSAMAAAVDDGALQQARQEKAAAEQASVAAEKRHQAEIAGLRNELAARDEGLADLRAKMAAQEERLTAALAEQGEVEVQRASGKKKEADLNGVVTGLKAELNALREETQKALKQAAAAEAAVQEARAETAKALSDRDVYKEAAEKERVAANATRERMAAELAKEKEAGERLGAELSRLKADAATQEAAGRSQLAKSAAELERVQQEYVAAQKEYAELQKKFEKARKEREDAREEGRASLAELEQVREELAALQDDVAHIVADQEGQRRKLSDRARTAEAEVDRLMQSLVDTESAWSVRLHALEGATAERVTVLKGVVEQLWPMDGVAGSGEVTASDLARIAAAPLKLSAGSSLALPVREATVVTAKKPVAAVPLPKIPIVPDFDEIEAVVATPPVPEIEELAAEELTEELVAEDLPEEDLPEEDLSTREPSRGAGFFADDFVPSGGADAGGQAPGKEHVAISFDDEEWGDLDLSGGGSEGEPVNFRHNPALAKWMIDFAKVKELHTSVNVQQIAPPGGGPGTFQAYVCRGEKEPGVETCYVVLEQTDGAGKKLVYEPAQEAAMGKLVHDALFFVESIGFMMLGVDLQQDNDKRAAALKKCRLFIRN